MIRLAVITGLILLWISPVFSSDSPLQNLNCYLVQMHLHAHTNHNGNDLPASMEWHCAYAESHGFDVIWWSEHSELFDTYDDMKIDFGSATLNKEAGSIDLGLTRSPRRLSSVKLEPPADNWEVSIEGTRLRIKVGSHGGREFDILKLTPASKRGPVKTVRWCRPVTSGLRFEVAMDITGLSDDSFLRFKFGLAAHPEGRHHLLFEVFRGTGSDLRVIGDTLVVQRIGIADSRSKFSLDLEKAAGHLPDGYDNTLGSLSIEFGVRNGAVIEAILHSLTLISDRPTGDNQYRVIKQLAERYASRYDVTQYVGVEVGKVHTPRRPHMNAFFPESTETLVNLTVDPKIERAQWAANVYRCGGLVSLNHPFGASLDPSARGLGDGAASVPLRDLAEIVGPMSEEDLWTVAEPIIETGGLGCHIIEVGYLFRGTGSLSDHLRLWDLLVAHGIRLVGNAVSDAHGGKWGPDMRPNPFASWIWATGKDRGELLQALEAGSVSFGNPFLFSGEFAFGVGDALMGDTLYVRRGDEPKGWIHLKPWDDDLEVRLVQVKIGAAREPVYIRRERLVDPGHGFKIRVEDACFARVEVYTRDGQALLFSNPVFLIPGR